MTLTTGLFLGVGGRQQQDDIPRICEYHEIYENCIGPQAMQE